MAKKIIARKKRRICKIKGCKQVLSIYNPSEFCHAHQRAALLEGYQIVASSRN